MADELNALGYADSLPFLLSQVGSRIGRRFMELLEPYDLSPREFGALANLHAAEGQTQQQLADTLGLHRNVMVGLVDELEAGGWVLRARRPDDRRAFALRLTPEGRALVGQVNALIPLLEHETVGGLSPDERATLGALLRRVADGLGLQPAVHPRIAEAQIGAERRRTRRGSRRARAR